MAITGIIAEYNPLHTGHLYQIRKVKEARRAEALVIVMSGSFVQRGEAAIVDKYRRTAMALRAGADLVIELPPALATGSAPVFARGAVALLKESGVVEELVFGAPLEDMDQYQKAAAALEAAEQSGGILQGLREGLSYPAAVGRAIREQDAAAADCLEDPNSLLGLSYIRAVEELEAPLSVGVIRRQGDSHGKESLPAQGFASATAIRRGLLTGDEASYGFLPEGCAQELPYRMAPDDISHFLSAALLIQSARGREALCQFADVSEDLAGRIQEAGPFDAPFSELAEQIKSRNYSAARVRRALLHIALNIRGEDQHLPNCIKILGMKKGSRLPAMLKKKARLPIITKSADQDPALVSQFNYAQRVYNQIAYAKWGIRLPDDYRQSPLVL